VKQGFALKLVNKVDSSNNLVITITLINMLLAVAALGKDILMASYLGTSNNSDAFALAFFITDMLGNNLIANAATVSCIPLLTKITLKRDKDSLYKSLISIDIRFFTITIVLALLMITLRTPIITGLANGFSSSTTALSIKLFTILVPTIIMSPLVTAGVSYLQVNGKFIVSSLAPVIFNIVFLIGIIFCYILNLPTDKGVYIISFSVLLSFVSMLLLIYCSVGRKDVIIKDCLKSNARLNSELLKLFIPYSLILTIAQAVLYYERYLASQFQSGSVAALNYTFRLSQFPIWIFVSAIGTVVFPTMSKHISSGNHKEMDAVFKKSVWWVLILTLPIMILIYILRLPIVEVLFLRGAFDKASLNITVEILSGYTFVILGQSITAISLKRFLAKEEMKKPLIIYLLSSGLNIVLDYYLVKTFGIGGLGYGAALSSIINTALMLYISEMDLRLLLNNNIIKITKLALANLAVVLTAYYGSRVWNLYIFSNGFLLKLLYLSVVISFILIFYGFILKLLKLL
jgi:putative peptidoglycan lipid II flippase